MARDPKDLDEAIAAMFRATFGGGVRRANEEAAAQHLRSRFYDGPKLSERLWGAGEAQRESIIDYLRTQYRAGRGVGETPGFPKNTVLSQLRAWYDQGPSEGLAGTPDYVARRLAVTESAFYHQALDNAVDEELEAAGMIDGYEILLSPEREEWDCDCRAVAEAGPYETLDETPILPRHPLCQCRRRPIILGKKSEEQKAKESAQRAVQALARTARSIAVSAVVETLADHALQWMINQAAVFIYRLKFTDRGAVLRLMASEIAKHYVLLGRENARYLFRRRPVVSMDGELWEPSAEVARALRGSTRRIERQLTDTAERLGLPAPKAMPKGWKPPPSAEFDRTVREFLDEAIRGARPVREPMRARVAKPYRDFAVFEPSDTERWLNDEIFKTLFRGAEKKVGSSELLVIPRGGVAVPPRPSTAGVPTIARALPAPAPATPGAPPAAAGGRLRPVRLPTTPGTPPAAPAATAGAPGAAEAGRPLIARVWPVSAVAAASLGQGDDAMVIPPGSSLRPFFVSEDDEGNFVVDFRELPTAERISDYDPAEITDRLMPEYRGGSVTDETKANAVAAWQAMFPIGPEEVVEHMLFGINVEQVAYTLTHYRALNGEPIIELDLFTDRFQATRAFRGTPEGVTVSHTQFDVKPEWRNQGVGTDFITNSVYLYESLGFAKVTTQAGGRQGDVGQYVWARFGFVPQPGDWTKIRNQNLRPWLSGNRHRMTQAEIIEFEGILAIDNVRGIWAMASNPYGREALMGGLGAGWRGHLDLQDAETMRRFNAYTSRIPLVMRREIEESVDENVMTLQANMMRAPDRTTRLLPALDDPDAVTRRLPPAEVIRPEERLTLTLNRAGSETTEQRRARELVEQLDALDRRPLDFDRANAFAVWEAFFPYHQPAELLKLLQQEADQTITLSRPSEYDLEWEVSQVRWTPASVAEGRPYSTDVVVINVFNVRDPNDPTRLFAMTFERRFDGADYQRTLMVEPTGDVLHRESPTQEFFDIFAIADNLRSQLNLDGPYLRARDPFALHWALLTGMISTDEPAVTGGSQLIDDLRNQVLELTNRLTGLSGSRLLHPAMPALQAYVDVTSSMGEPSAGLIPFTNHWIAMRHLHQAVLLPILTDAPSADRLDRYPIIFRPPRYPMGEAAPMNPTQQAWRAFRDVQAPEIRRVRERAWDGLVVPHWEPGSIGWSDDQIRAARDATPPAGDPGQEALDRLLAERAATTQAVTLPPLAPGEVEQPALQFEESDATRYLTHHGPRPTEASLRAMKAEWGKEPATADELKAAFGVTFDQSEVDHWNQRVRMTGAQFVSAFYAYMPPELVGDYRWNIRINSSSLHWEITTSRAATGISISSMSRTVYFNDASVSHSYFKLHNPDRALYRSPGKAAFNTLLDLYEYWGIERIGVSAGLDQGGYVWGKYGFQIQSGGYQLAETFVENILGRDWDSYVHEVYSDSSSMEYEDVVEEAVDDIARDEGFGYTLNEWHDELTESERQLVIKQFIAGDSIRWQEVFSEKMREAMDEMRNDDNAKEEFYNQVLYDENMREMSDPKVIWDIADHDQGHSFLAGRGWSGELDLTDLETLDRINAYIDRGQPRDRLFDAAEDHAQIKAWTFAIDTGVSTRNQAIAVGLDPDTDETLADFVPTSQALLVRPLPIQPTYARRLDAAQHEQAQRFLYTQDYEMRVRVAIAPMAERQTLLAREAERLLLNTGYVADVDPTQVLEALRRMPGIPAEAKLLLRPHATYRERPQPHAAAVSLQVEAMVPNVAFDEEAGESSRNYRQFMFSAGLVMQLRDPQETTRTPFLPPPLDELIHTAGLAAYATPGMGLTPNEYLNAIGYLFRTANSMPAIDEIAWRYEPNQLSGSLGLSYIDNNDSVAVARERATIGAIVALLDADRIPFFLAGLRAGNMGQIYQLALDRGEIDQALFDKLEQLHGGTSEEGVAARRAAFLELRKRGAYRVLGEMALRQGGSETWVLPFDRKLAEKRLPAQGRPFTFDPVLQPVPMLETATIEQAFVAATGIPWRSYGPSQLPARTDPEMHPRRMEGGAEGVLLLEEPAVWRAHSMTPFTEDMSQIVRQITTEAQVQLPALMSRLLGAASARTFEEAENVGILRTAHLTNERVMVVRLGAATPERAAAFDVTVRRGWDADTDRPTDQMVYDVSAEGPFHFAGREPMYRAQRVAVAMDRVVQITGAVSHARPSHETTHVTFRTNNPLLAYFLMRGGARIGTVDARGRANNTDNFEDTTHRLADVMIRHVQERAGEGHISLERSRQLVNEIREAERQETALLRGQAGYEVFGFGASPLTHINRELMVRTLAQAIDVNASESHGQVPGIHRPSGELRLTFVNPTSGTVQALAIAVDRMRNTVDRFSEAQIIEDLGDPYAVEIPADFPVLTVEEAVQATRAAMDGNVVVWDTVRRGFVMSGEYAVPVAGTRNQTAFDETTPAMAEQLAEFARTRRMEIEDGNLLRIAPDPDNEGIILVQIIQPFSVDDAEAATGVAIDRQLESVYRLDPSTPAVPIHELRSRSEIEAVVLPRLDVQARAYVRDLGWDTLITDSGNEITAASLTDYANERLVYMTSLWETSDPDRLRAWRADYYDPWMHIRNRELSYLDRISGPEANKLREQATGATDPSPETLLAASLNATARRYVRSLGWDVPGRITAQSFTEELERRLEQLERLYGDSAPEVMEQLRSNVYVPWMAERERVVAKLAAGATEARAETMRIELNEWRDVRPLREREPSINLRFALARHRLQGRTVHPFEELGFRGVNDVVAEYQGDEVAGEPLRPILVLDQPHGYQGGPAERDVLRDLLTDPSTFDLEERIPDQFIDAVVDMFDGMDGGYGVEVVANGGVDLPDGRSVFQGTVDSVGIFLNVNELARDHPDWPWTPETESYTDPRERPRTGGWDESTIWVGRELISESVMGMALHEIGHGMTTRALNRALAHDAVDAVSGLPMTDGYDISPAEQKLKDAIEALFDGIYGATADWYEIVMITAAERRAWLLSDYHSNKLQDYIRHSRFAGGGFNLWRDRHEEVVRVFLSESVAESFVGMALDQDRFRAEYPLYAAVVDAAVNAQRDRRGIAGDFAWPAAGDLGRANRDVDPPAWFKQSLVSPVQLAEPRPAVEMIPVEKAPLRRAPPNAPGLVKHAEALERAARALHEALRKGSRLAKGARVRVRLDADRRGLLERLGQREGIVDFAALVLPKRGPDAEKWVQERKGRITKSAFITLPVKHDRGLPTVVDYSDYGEVRTLAEERASLARVFGYAEVVWREGDLATFLVSTSLGDHYDAARAYGDAHYALRPDFLMAGRRVYDEDGFETAEIDEDEELGMFTQESFDGDTWPHRTGSGDYWVPTLYHGTSLPAALAIREQGLKPGIGAWVETVYGGMVPKYNPEDYDNDPEPPEFGDALVPTSFLADPTTSNVAVAAMLTHIAFQLGLDSRMALRSGSVDLTIADVLSRGAVAVFRNFDPHEVRQLTEDGTLMSGIGELAPYEELDEPISAAVEHQDWFTTWPMEATDILMGSRLLQWIYEDQQRRDTLEIALSRQLRVADLRVVPEFEAGVPTKLTAFMDSWEGQQVTQVTIEAESDDHLLVVDEEGYVIANVIRFVGVTAEDWRELADEARQRQLRAQGNMRTMVRGDPEWERWPAPKEGDWVVIQEMDRRRQYKVGDHLPWYAAGERLNQLLPEWMQHYTTSAFSVFNRQLAPEPMSFTTRGVNPLATPVDVDAPFEALAVAKLKEAMWAIEDDPKRYAADPAVAALQWAVAQHDFSSPEYADFRRTPASGYRDTLIGPAVYATRPGSVGIFVGVRDLLKLSIDYLPLVPPKLAPYWTLSFLAAVLGIDTIKLGDGSYAIITSEASQGLESTALLTGPAERLEEVRVANPDLDFAYLHYRKRT